MIYIARIDASKLNPKHFIQSDTLEVCDTHVQSTEATHTHLNTTAFGLGPDDQTH